MFTPHWHNARQNHYIMMANKSLEIVAKVNNRERKKQIKITIKKDIRAN
jgi:hypothetical protein